jgi:hypothetical protein
VSAIAHRLSKAVVIASTTWLAVAIAWGLFARVGSGHEAVVSARAIIAENMNTWGIWGPVRQYTLQRPGAELYYAHHPWGTFWIISAFAKFLGRAPYVPRLVAILMSVSLPPLLYGIGRALWGPVPGALAALAYSVLPITLAFGNFPGFEGQLNFGCLLATWGYLRFAQGWKRRWTWVSLLGVLIAANTDWEANIFFGIVVAILSLVAFFVPPRWFGRYNLPRFGQWAGLVGLILAATLVLYMGYFARISAIEGLLNQEAKRSRGNELPLLAVLGSRRYWIDVCFTPLAVTVGKIALPIFVFRVIFLRRLHEIFPLAYLVMAVIQYVKFKNGADVHIYWPLPFAPYWALSVGLLGAVSIGAAKRLLPLIRRKLCGNRDWRGLVEPAALGAFALLPLAILPDGVDGLRYARATGGRFNEKGSRMLQDKDKSQAMEWMASSMAPQTVVQVHEGLHVAWGQDWAVHRPLRSAKDVPAPAGPGPLEDGRYFVADLRFLSMLEQRKLFDTFHVVAVGPYAYIDRQSPRAPADAYVFVEREPRMLEWYLAYPTEPVRTIVPDAFYTWELRDHFGQSPNPPPPDPPQTREQRRILHNVAVSQHDDARAKDLEAQLAASLDRSAEAEFTGGDARLLGQSLHRGVAPELAFFFLSAGPLDNEYEFTAWSLMVKSRALSLVDPDERRKQSGVPFWISPRLWKRGYVYAEYCDIRRRPGVERYTGQFTVGKGAVPPSAPRPKVGPAEIPLMTLP